jgi:serine/threonine protein kinase
LNEALLLVGQLCQVVQYAHQHGVLHRDIKPANLMLKPEPTEGLPFRVILTDLGLAKLVEGLGMTQEGTSLGTPAYMSPEQALGQSTDPRSDVYSLGILLYELAVGRIPFPIRSSTEAIRYHTKETPPSPRALCPELSESLERVFLKALEKDPAKRYQSAAELGAVLARNVSSSTEIIDQAAQNAVSLITKYEDSLVTPLRPASASLMTVFGNETMEPRGGSVFGEAPVSPSPDARIQVVHKNSTTKVLKLQAGTVTIGRGKENHIVLEDEKASRRHAQITWDGMEYHLMDLGSSNGTYLENARLLPGISEILKPNQNLRIGDTWLRIIQPSMKASGIVSQGVWWEVLPFTRAPVPE